MTLAIENELKRLKMYFPYRIVWAAISPDGDGKYVTGANATKAQVNAYQRKGWDCYILGGK